MFGSLDASNYIGSVPFYEKEFEIILSKIVVCYNLMLAKGITLESDENEIRNTLVNDFLNDREIKQQLKLEYFINPEVPEPNNKRPDIKFQSVNSWSNPKEYFSIECKVLDNENVAGTSGRNAKYIKEGIYRFTSMDYSSYHRVNGMLGFIVEKMNIHTNVNHINELLQTSLKKANTTKKITKDSFIDDFEYQYHSTHLDRDNHELKIYHLMLNFSKNIAL